MNKKKDEQKKMNKKSSVFQAVISMISIIFEKKNKNKKKSHLSHIKYMGGHPRDRTGTTREVPLPRTPPADQTPAEGAWGDMPSLKDRHAQSQPGRPRICRPQRRCPPHIILYGTSAIFFFLFFFSKIQLITLITAWKRLRT